MSPESCCCCGAGELEPRHRVRGEVGAAGLIPTTDEFGTALADISRCRRCGHMQLEPMPGADRLDRLYEDAESEEYVAEEAGQRETARRLLARIERHTSPGRLLDVGSWVGYLPAEAEARGWSVVGLEPSRWAASFAREQLGLDVRNEMLSEAALDAGSFDAVFMGDVIEHLVDPGATLAQIREPLSADGFLALALPDAGSLVARAMGRRWWSVIPTHVQYFTRASLATLLHRSGFEVLEVDTAPKTFSLGYYLGRLGGYSPRMGGSLVRVASAAGLAERMVAPDLRDRMFVLATPARS